MAQVNISGGGAKNLKLLSELRLGVQTRTAAAAITLTVDSPTLQFIDPGGAGRDVNLPAEADSEGLVFIISNEADAAEILTVKNDGGTAIVTPTQNEACIVFCDGVSWSGIVGATS